MFFFYKKHFLASAWAFLNFQSNPAYALPFNSFEYLTNTIQLTPKFVTF